MWEGNDEKGFTEKRLFQVTQAYSKYRFFGVETMDTFIGAVPSNRDR